ncbi:hypothetical protein L1049_007677 [Liquidambar formosana]|uniref:Uncharacterized protein n=1 Tax=Liquidambar formosana TaxID=63359 RepID=A0AAP0X4U7_LIQFO
MNTLDRHGSRPRPDVQDPVPTYGGFGPASSFSGWILRNHCVMELITLRYQRQEWNSGRTLNEPQRGSMRVIPSTLLSEASSCANGTAVSGYRLSGDAKDLATSRIQGLRISDDTPKSSPPSSEGSISPIGKAYHAPHLYFSRSHNGNGEMRNEIPDRRQPENFGFTDEKVSYGILHAPDEETGFIVRCDLDKNQFVTNHEVLTVVGSKDGPSIVSPVVGSLEDFHPGYREKALAWTTAIPEDLNPLPDLNGDYDSHLYSLRYGRWCCESALSAPVPHMPPPLLSQLQSENSWEARWSVQMRQNRFPHMNANGVVTRPAFYLMNPPMAPGAAFGIEEKPKPRGTGTYFPNTNHYRDRSLTARGRHQAPVRSPRNNGRAIMPSETNLIEKSSRELSQAQSPIHQGGGKPVFSDFPQLDSPGPGGKAYPSANGTMLPSEKGVEFGSLGNLPMGAPLLENGRQPNPGSSLSQDFTLNLPAARMQSPNIVLDMNQDRVAVQAFHLTDEEDFPRLSV